MDIPAKPFYFIRHGQTDWNVGKLVTGRSEVPINETGARQAREVSRILKRVEPNCCIYTSPLVRAQQTAEIVRQEILSQVVIINGLQERGWGNLEGELSSEKNKVANGVESGVEFNARILAALEVILLTNDPMPVLISHGDVFAAMVRQMGLGYLRSDNCELFFFYPSKEVHGQWSVINYSSNYWI